MVPVACPPGPYFPLRPDQRELVPALGALVDLVRIGAAAVAESPRLVRQAGSGGSGSPGRPLPGA
jgi:hypothetical protein